MAMAAAFRRSRLSELRLWLGAAGRFSAAIRFGRFFMLISGILSSLRSMPLRSTTTLNHRISPRLPSAYSGKPQGRTHLKMGRAKGSESKATPQPRATLPVGDENCGIAFGSAMQQQGNRSRTVLTFPQVYPVSTYAGLPCEEQWWPQPKSQVRKETGEYS